MIIRDILQQKGNLVLGVPPETLVSEAVRTMTEKDIGSLVILQDGKMVGLLTGREVLRGLNRHGESLGKCKVADVMAPDPVVGHPDDSLDFVRGIMTDNHVTHLPVVDQDQLVGIISFHDVAKVCLREVSYENIMLKRYIRHWPEESEGA